MNRTMIGALALIALSVPGMADTAYPIDQALAKANRAKVEASRKDAYWKASPFAVAAVNPLSGIRRDPSLYPEDGDFTGPVRVLASRDEYEGASVVLFGFSDADKVLLQPGDLIGEGGARFSASNIDTKIVKVWYQQGTAWGSFFSDPLRRLPTPELMVYDDDLIFVDHENKENYFKSSEGGKTFRRWFSFNGAIVDHSYDGNVKPEWIQDAAKLQPFSVRKDEFKQLIMTFHVPGNQAPGLYKGSIAATVGGKKVCDIPVELKVLPITLPLPKTFYSLERPFMVSPYMGKGTKSLYESEKVARNMVRHNVRNCLLPGISTPSDAKKAYEMMKRTGMDTEYLFTVLPGCGLTTSYPASETDANYLRFKNTSEALRTSMEAIREVFGPDAKAYSYGIDEGSAWTVRAERATWESVHKEGGRTVVATRWHPYILFNLDYANVPRHPRAHRKAEADAFHAANPDGIMGWYADPHSGPENPDYTRRIYGWQTWRNNFDASCQYILFRDNWNDFFVPAEANLRGLMLVYPQKDDLIDTIEWEGLREGLDDVRYGTLLKQLGEKARTSKNVETVYAGRAALTWLAQVDCEHSGLDYLRYEMINRILDLQTRLAKEGK